MSQFFWVAASAYGIYKVYKTIKKPNYANYGGEFEDDFARMGTQQEPLNKPSANNKSVREVDDFTANKKSGKFDESSLDESYKSN